MNEILDNLELFIFVPTDLDHRTDETLLACRQRRSAIGLKLLNNLKIRQNVYTHARDKGDEEVIENEYICWMIAIENIETYSRILTRPELRS